MKTKTFILLLYLLIFLLDVAVCSRGDTLHLRKNDEEMVWEHYGFARSPGNFAMSAFLNRSYLSCAFTNSYFLKELMDKRAVGLLGYRDNMFVVGVSHFGYARYGELVASAGYARQFAHRFSFALGFYYYFNHALNYPVTHSVTFDVSFYAKCTSRCGIGVRVFNPAHLRYGISDISAAYLDMLFDLDFHYQVSRQLLLYLNVEKVLDGGFSIGGGLFYVLNRRVGIVAEITMPSPRAALGLQMTWQHFELQIDMAYRYKLGFSPQVSFSFPFKKCRR